MLQRAAVFAIAALLLFPASLPTLAAAPAEDPAVPAILSTAESLFQTMKARDYTATWAVLTAKSRDTIVSETEEAIRKAGGQAVPKDEIRGDFAAGGPLCRKYWEGFLRRFDPDDALEKSRWEMGPVNKDRAEVLITHRRADRPAVLQMFREEGVWKAGLVETFWRR